MKKTISLLIVPIVVLSIVSGLLFNQLLVAQNENSELENELFEVNTQWAEVNKELEEEQNARFQLESQVIELQNQTEQLEQSLVELENQRNELEDQISKATNIVKITAFKICGGIIPIGGLTHVSCANATIENFGTNSVEGLSLLLNTVSSYGEETLNKKIPIEVLHVGEELKISTRVDYVFACPGGTSYFTARLMLDDVVLSESSSRLM